METGQIQKLTEVEGTAALSGSMGTAMRPVEVSQVRVRSRCAKQRAWVGKGLEKRSGCQNCDRA